MRLLGASLITCVVSHVIITFLAEGGLSLRLYGTDPDTIGSHREFL